MILMSNSKIRRNDLRRTERTVETHPELQSAVLQAQTRRHFLRTLGSGLGTLFVGTSLAKYANAANDAGLDFTRDASTPLSALPPQFAAKDSTRYLSAHGRSAQPTGTLRAQTRPQAPGWPGLSRIVPRGKTFRIHQRRSQAPRLAISVPAGGTEWAVDIRSSASS